MCCFVLFVSKRTRLEFIVTLDGFEDRMKSPQKDSEPPKRRRSSRDREPSPPHKPLDKSSSLTQSDEEFEKILLKKEKEEREKSAADESRRSTRRSHRSRRRSRSRSPEMNDVDREIMIAEKKLKAQKLLKKSLDQVQSINTETFGLKPKTAFVNPHFKPKDYAPSPPVMNVLPLNVAGQPIVASQAMHTAPLLIQAQPVRPIVMLNHPAVIASKQQIMPLSGHVLSPTLLSPKPEGNYVSHTHPLNITELINYILWIEFRMYFIRRLVHFTVNFTK